jgi:hypothetical protein
MDKRERQELQAMCAEVWAWSESARALQADRDRIEAAAVDTLTTLARRAVHVNRDAGVAWTVIPLADGADRVLVANLAARANLRPLGKGDEDALVFLTRAVPPILDDVAGLLSRRFFIGRKRREAGDRAVPKLHSGIAWGRAQGIATRLAHLAQSRQVFSPPATLQALLDDRLGFIAGARQRFGEEPVFLPLDRDTIARLAPAVRIILTAVEGEAAVRKAAMSAGEAVRKAETRDLLVEIPVEQIKKTTADRLRIEPLKEVGIRTILDVLDNKRRISEIRGVGEMTERQVIAAAQSIWKTTYDEMPVRIDIRKRSAQATTLLTRLAKWDATRRTKGAESDVARARELAAFARALRTDTTHALVFQRQGLPASTLTDSIEAVIRRAQLLEGEGANGGGLVPEDVWEDFLSRPADYYAMLSELGFLSEDAGKAHGDLPDEIVEAIRAQDLRTEHLRASLRGYQSFAARFALVQRKVIFGDEMGLGKTVEALAVLCHLRSKGAAHFLVVCPASVVTNWTREVSAKTKLRAHRLHGPDRALALRNWRRTGGVAVTTFDMLAWLETEPAMVTDLGCVVVDEAHYLKNPATRRAQRTSAIIGKCERAVLLTGTPMENRVEEFSNLASYIRSDLAAGSAGLTPRAFRKHIAPAYLRRNQEDVLTELPELVEVEEWIPMSAPDKARYRQAVADGNFMAMRQAAFQSGSRSEKLQRLLEIAQEAAKNNRKTIVYSYFRDVLATVVNAVPGTVIGPLTGSVPPARRQEMVDRFAAAEDGAVLTAQIAAGGVGLNIQAASIVIICEPQLKPTSEAQAIARAHRMGQVQTVQVHRLLSEESVDERITEILAAKRQLFDEYARISATADSTPDAVDISDAELARAVIAAERERLLSRPVPIETDADQEL